MAETENPANKVKEVRSLVKWQLKKVTIIILIIFMIYFNYN